MAHDRFVNDTISQLQEANCSPIDGYQHFELQTLEKATEELIPFVTDLANSVWDAKHNCNQSSTLLTTDESAAIYLYSMANSFFSRLNETLRAENRNTLQPWFAFLKLFITALEKLPSTKQTVWRGVSGNVGSIFDDGDVHTWWSVNSCSMDLKVVEMYLGKTGTIFAIDAVRGKNISEFSSFQQEQEIVLMPGTRLSAKSRSLNLIDRFFLVSLEEDTSQSYVCELTKREYQQNSRIARIMNPSKSFPIKESYINLAIVETKEQQNKEKKLLDATLNDKIIGTYEEIYGTKIKIEVKDIFEKCKDQIKKVLVFGRAGIGKTTFCRYVAYQWATGVIWQQYQLVIVIHLRNLTDNRYPPSSPGNKYSLIDLVKTEYCCENLSNNDEKLFNEQLDNNQVLWLLDGYDEIVQSIPSHLEYLLEQLLKTSHHILTSRPYLNTLSYKVEMEIIGFTDDNIKKYVAQFFDQPKDETDNPSVQSKNLLNFLKCNPRIWGIVHIPVNLELICSLWSNTNWSDTTTLSMTTVYDKMVEWLCRRYLQKQSNTIPQMRKNTVYKRCDKELAFLETLAFHGMQENAIILPPKLLEKSESEIGYSLDEYPQLLNIGILKSFDDRVIGTHIEAEKNHYFLHLSFQEHFTARYLVNALNGEIDKKTKAINFIKVYKYNKRFELVFTFVSGLLNDNNTEQSINLFWKTLLEEPLDIIGIRHMQLIIYCIDEGGCNTFLSHYHESMNTVIKWINYFISEKHDDRDNSLIVALQRSSTLVNQTEILDIFVKLCNHEDSVVKKSSYLLFSTLPVINSRKDLINLHLTAVNDGDEQVGCSACEALGNSDEKTATSEIINGLVQSAFCNRHFYVRKSAREALRKIGETATTDEIIHRLVSALNNTTNSIRVRVCTILDEMNEKETISEKINRLVSLLDNTTHRFRNTAREGLNKMSETATTNEIITRLSNALDNNNDHIRMDACKLINEMGEKAATIEIINKLGNALGDKNDEIKLIVCNILGKMGEKVATNEIINRLGNALGDTDARVRMNACDALGKMGKKAATNEIINKLVSALSDRDDGIARSVCNLLGEMGKKAATNEIINGLTTALDDSHAWVRQNACEALGKIGEKAATNEIIHKLVSALDDSDYWVSVWAYFALGNMGEKAATNEIINKLAAAVANTDDGIRTHACEALEKIGVNEATNELILVLLDASYDNKLKVRYEVANNIGRILHLSSNMSLLQTDTVKKLSELMNKLEWRFIPNISPGKLMRAFLDKKISFWLTIIKRICIRYGHAIVLTADNIIVYDNKESVNFSFPNRELEKELRDYLVGWLEKKSGEEVDTKIVSEETI